MSFQLWKLYGELFVCAPRRVTTSVLQPTCPSVSWSAAVVLLCPWSTPPTWWTYGKRPPVSSRFIHRTQSTAGPWMMSLSLPIQLAWQVRQTPERHETGECVGDLPGHTACVCVLSIVCPFFALLQMCRCMCATKKRMGISQCRCAPTQPCRMRRTVSYIRSSRSWVSQEVEGVKNQT